MVKINLKWYIEGVFKKYIDKPFYFLYNLEYIMKKIELTQNKYALVDDEDFEELNQYKWYCNNNNYVVRTDNKLKKKIRIHRVIMNPPNNMVIDHINGNGLDNRKENLRICTQSQNAGNSKIPKNNISGIKGVI